MQHGGLRGPDRFGPIIFGNILNGEIAA